MSKDKVNLATLEALKEVTRLAMEAAGELSRIIDDIPEPFQSVVGAYAEHSTEVACLQGDLLFRGTCLHRGPTDEQVTAFLAASKRATAAAKALDAVREDLPQYVIPIMNEHLVTSTEVLQLMLVITNTAVGRSS